MPYLHDATRRRRGRTARGPRPTSSCSTPPARLAYRGAPDANYGDEPRGGVAARGARRLLAGREVARAGDRAGRVQRQVEAVMAPFVHRLRVRYHECDQQGRVFNAHYFAYFDITLTELWREAFGSYEQMLREGYDVVVADASARFKGAAAFDDEIDVAMTIANLGEPR